MNKPDLTIGMAVHDDLDGLYFTVQAINAFHPEIRNKIEILVLDNNPSSKHGEAVADFLKHVNNARYFPYDVWKSTAVRDVLFHEAKSDYVLCADSHILYMPGSIARLIDFYKQNAYCGDLLQGPMFYDCLTAHATHFDHTWQNGMLGVWGDDERGKDPDSPPFEIEMQGLGTFSCRKDAWLGFNRLFRGFGGEEWYIHEKYRKAGKKALCLPFLRWTHRFRRPDGVNYHLHLDDRVYNYFVGHLELGVDADPIFEHFRDSVGDDRCGQLYELAKNDLMLQPLRLQNSASEIKIVSCLMVVNNVSQMHLNEAVESFHRQYYQARELVIFNDGHNIIQCDHPLVKIINYPEGLSSLDECVNKALPACNGDVICLWDCHGIELPWRISVDMEMIDSGYEFWRSSSFWRGEADGMIISPSNYNEFALNNCSFKRDWLASNSLINTIPTEDLEWTKMSTITRDAQYANNDEPIIIDTGWRVNYADIASRTSIQSLNKAERDRKMPIFIAVCDIVSWAELAIENINRIGNFEIILVDNSSTNPKMIEFLNDSDYEVIKLDKGVPQDQIWSNGIYRDVDGLFIAVHSFFDLSGLPDNTVKILHDTFDVFGISRCGVSVFLDDIPDSNPCLNDIMSREQMHFENEDGDYYNTDAGFAFIIGRSDRLSEKFSDWYAPQRRLRQPYIVRYRPWYLDLSSELSDDILYYIEHHTGDSIANEMVSKRRSSASDRSSKFYRLMESF